MNKESIKCKCTGITGGCVYKFCHRRVAPFTKIAVDLLHKYDAAVKVQYPTVVSKDPQQPDTEDKTNVKDAMRRKNGVKNDITTQKTIGENEENKLVYLNSLTDHCLEENSVSGRQCSLEESAVDNCRKLCCRGHREKRIEVHSECRCKFVYCCRVDCDTCISFKNIHQCI